MRIVAIGEVLWDVFPEMERLGGAPFNFSVQASRLGHEVRFVSAVGDDARGLLITERMRELGLSTECVGTVDGVATGMVSVQLDAAGKPEFTLQRPAAYDAVRLSSDALERLRAWAPQWLYFGTLHQIYPEVRALTARLMQTLDGARRFYDVNLRPPCYTRELIEAMLAAANVVKLNDDEAIELDAMFGFGSRPIEEFTAHWMEKFGWQAVAVTRGAKGSAVRIGGDYAEPAGFAVHVVDTVGSGDAFAAAFLHGLSQGWDARACGEFANRVGAVVASRAGAIPEWTMEDCARLVSRSA